MGRLYAYRDKSPRIAASAVLFDSAEVTGDVVIGEGSIIGPGAMIHGCHLGAGTVVEPAAIVCDSSRVGAGSVIRAGACVKQRARFDDRAVLDGFPTVQVGSLDAEPGRPAWAFDLEDLPTPLPVAP